jgi:hypothetical protein
MIAGWAEGGLVPRILCFHEQWTMGRLLLAQPTDPP